VEVFEEQDIAGGQANLIPDARLDKDILSSDLEFTGKTFGVRIEYGRKFSDLDEFKGRYDAIIQECGPRSAHPSEHPRCPKRLSLALICFAIPTIMTLKANA
jgi:hypothetical protein